MKNNKFQILRKSLSEKKNKGETVFSKRISRIPVEIIKTGNNSFDAYVDGDKLDNYRSQKEAERMTIEFIKQSQ